MEQRLIDANALIKKMEEREEQLRDDRSIYESSCVVTALDMFAPTVLTIPENPTNGDIIRALFPNVEVKEKNNGYEIYFGVGTAIQFFNYKWWDAPYKAESEDGE